MLVSGRLYANGCLLQNGSMGKHIPYSRACYTGLGNTVYLQLLHILPDHVKTGLNMQSFCVCALIRFCLLHFVFYTIYHCLIFIRIVSYNGVDISNP